LILIAPGGIGNQLFVIAAALHLSERTKHKIWIFSDNKELVIRCQTLIAESNFSNKIAILFSTRLARLISEVSSRLFVLGKKSKLFHKFIEGRIVVIDKPWEFIPNPDNLENKKIKVLLGFFQDKKLIEALSPKNQEFMKKILGVASPGFLSGNHQRHESIGVHVRRGDYLQITDYGVLSDKYFIDAVQSLLTPESKVVLASDDDEALIRIGKFSNQLLLFSSTHSPLSTIEILVKSTKFIMSNSTFSFWIGWAVHQQGGQVFAPSPWHKNSDVPKDFLRLDGFITRDSEFG
jgi:hypothetical protein